MRVSSLAYGVLAVSVGALIGVLVGLQRHDVAGNPRATSKAGVYTRSTATLATDPGYIARRVIVGVDRSLSAQALFERYKGFVDLVVQYVLPSDGCMELLFFANRLTKVYEGLIRDPRDLWAAVDQYLRTGSPDRGTCPGLVLEHAGKKLDSDPASAAAIVLIWDGGNEDRDRSLSELAGALASRPNFIGLWVVGVKDELRLSVESDLSPIPPPKLLISGLSDVEVGLRRFRRLVKAFSPASQYR
ncbi:MAG: VWA domain-containing protein [Armatimonadetes bacterium]|nr:VWA domain-containing protein [Armatimonadota bacterium]